MPFEGSEIIIDHGYIFDQNYFFQSLGGVDSVNQGLRIDTGTVRCDVRVSTKELAKTVIFSVQFGIAPRIQLTKTTTNSGLTTSELRDGTVSVTTNGTIGFTAHYTLNNAAFGAADWINLHWIAIGTW
jgi:hypothetical protein